MVVKLQRNVNNVYYKHKKISCIMLVFSRTLTLLALTLFTLKLSISRTELNDFTVLRYRLSSRQKNQKQTLH